MSDIISNSFNDYRCRLYKFEQFHNQVINMPRATFKDIPKIIKLLKNLASYILLIDKEVLSKPMNSEQCYKEIYTNYHLNIVPKFNRNLEFEETFLKPIGNFKQIYKDLGRRFRHYTELLSFFNIFKRTKNNKGNWGKKSIFDIDDLKELELSDESYLFDVFRNKLLNLNIKDNSHIVILKGINLREEADYRPARAIIRYINDMGREVTDFEIAILLGRIDEIQTENKILVRANNVGKQFPPILHQQINMFFESMLWKTNGGTLFQYTVSQNPDFKFKTFIIMMETFGMIEYNHDTHYIKLTEYSRNLIREEIPLDVLDLQHLITRIEDGSENSNTLSELIIRKRTDVITKAIEEDGELVTKLNIWSIHHPIIRNKKRIRNNLIREVAKIKARYTDEVDDRLTFSGRNGRTYLEAHHIIEFKRENGPDITDNLICLGSYHHDLIHHGSKDVLDNFFAKCKEKGIINCARFEAMCRKYRCLTKEHVDALRNKGILNQEESTRLYNLIEHVGIDPFFLESLNVSASENS